MSDKPPPKHTEHGNYRRADWFEARCGELERRVEDHRESSRAYSAHAISLEARCKELEAAGDVLAHCLLFREHKPELEAWWKLRGGKCTVCSVGDTDCDDSTKGEKR